MEGLKPSGAWAAAVPEPRFYMRLPAGMLMENTNKIKTAAPVFELPQRLGILQIHVFGISMNSLRRVFRAVDSYDTSAWVYWAKKDGAALVWSRRRGAFIHLQARDGKRYSTEDLLEVNLRQILDMHRDLCMYRSAQTANAPERRGGPASAQGARAEQHDALLGYAVDLPDPPAPPD